MRSIRNNLPHDGGICICFHDVGPGKASPRGSHRGTESTRGVRWEETEGWKARRLKVGAGVCCADVDSVSAAHAERGQRGHAATG